MKRIVVYVSFEAYVDENISVKDIQEKVYEGAECLCHEGVTIIHNDEYIEFSFDDDVFIGTSAQLTIGGE